VYRIIFAVLFSLFFNDDIIFTLRGLYFQRRIGPNIDWSYSVVFIPFFFLHVYCILPNTYVFRPIRLRGAVSRSTCLSGCTIEGEIIYAPVSDGRKRHRERASLIYARRSVSYNNARGPPRRWRRQVGGRGEGCWRARRAILKPLNHLHVQQPSSGNNWTGGWWCANKYILYLLIRHCRTTRFTSLEN